MALNNQTRIIVKHHIVDYLFLHEERGTLTEVKLTNYVTNACNKAREPGDFFHVLPSIIHPLLRKLFPIGIKDTTSTGEFYLFRTKNKEYITLFREQFTIATLLRK